MPERYIGSDQFDQRIDGRVWMIPDGWTIKPKASALHCRSCQAPILFATNDKTGKASPFYPIPNVHEESVSTSHFATCPQAPSWRKAT